jgi:hypothetical protein
MGHLDDLAQQHSPTLWSGAFSPGDMTAAVLAEMYRVAVAPHLSFRRVYRERDGQRTISTLVKLIRKRKQQSASEPDPPASTSSTSSTVPAVRTRRPTRPSTPSRRQTSRRVTRRVREH